MPIGPQVGPESSPSSGSSGGGVTSFNTRTGAVTSQTGDYTAAEVTNAADLSSASTQTFTGQVSTPGLIVPGLTGATNGTVLGGGTVTGHPTSGLWVTGDYIIAADGHVWICTATGTPGTWVDAGSVGNLVTSVFGRTGAVVATNGDYTASQVGALASTSTLNAIAGSNPTTADISMSSHKLTNLTSGSSAKDAATYDQTAGSFLSVIGQGLVYDKTSAISGKQLSRLVFSDPGAGAVSATTKTSLLTAAYTVPIARNVGDIWRLTAGGQFVQNGATQSILLIPSINGDSTNGLFTSTAFGATANYRNWFLDVTMRLVSTTSVQAIATFSQTASSAAAWAYVGGSGNAPAVANWTVAVTNGSTFTLDLAGYFGTSAAASSWTCLAALIQYLPNVW